MVSLLWLQEQVQEQLGMAKHCTQSAPISLLAHQPQNLASVCGLECNWLWQVDAPTCLLRDFLCQVISSELQLIQVNAEQIHSLLVRNGFPIGLDSLNPLLWQHLQLQVLGRVHVEHQSGLHNT